MTRAELKEYRGLLAEAEGIRRTLEALRAKLESPGTLRADKAPSQGTGKDITGELLAAYIDKQAEYLKRLQEIEHKRAIIEHEISTLPALERAVVRQRYIDGVQIWKIAQVIRYSERQTVRILNEALAKLESGD